MKNGIDLRLTFLLLDAILVTSIITGPDRSFQPTGSKDAVWASDEKRFADERKAGKFRIAEEKADDELGRSVIPALQKQIDTDAAAKLGARIGKYWSLKGPQSNLLGRTDAASRAQLVTVNERLAQARKEIDSQAKALYAAAGTLEPFTPGSRLRPTYLFYKPVIFYNRARNPADTSFYQGMIRLQVRTDAINRRIGDSIASIIRTAGTIALAAAALGILAAFIVARITFTPIRHVTRSSPKRRIK